MTSRISFSKLRREDLKHRTSVIIVVSFCFLLRLLMFFKEVHNMNINKGTKEELYNTLLAFAKPDIVTGCMIGCIAILLAFNGFNYLHTKNKVDFYHAIPMKRKDQYNMILINNLLICLIPFLITLVIQSVVTVFCHCMTPEYMEYLLEALLCYLLVYGVVYFFMTLSIMLTGQSFISGLAMVVFCVYAPYLLYLTIDTLQREFFTTYRSAEGLSSKLEYFSPFSLAVSLMGRESNLFRYTGQNEGRFGTELSYIIVAAVWIVLLYIVCRRLFVKRPAEAAGRAMVFERLNHPIKFMITVPMALVTGILFYSMLLTSSKVWIFVGIIFGTVIFNGIIECIYQTDIKGLLSNKKHIVAISILSIGIALIFTQDLVGYDRYVAQDSKIEKVTMTMTSHMDSSDFWGEKQDEYTGAEKTKLLKALETITREEFQSGDARTQNIDVTYYPKSGFPKYRTYTLSSKQFDEIGRQLYETKIYRNSMYSLYTADWSKITDVICSHPITDTTLNLTKQEKETFLKTYLEELDTLSWDQLRSEIPIGMIVVNYRANKNQSGGDTYYIYPSFQKTIAFVKQKGAILGNTLKDVHIDSLVYTTYDKEWNGTETKITDQGLIMKIKPELYYATLLPIIHKINDSVENYDITANVKTPYGDDSISVIANASIMKQIKNQK